MKWLTSSCLLIPVFMLVAFQARPALAQYDQYNIYVHNWHTGTTIQVSSIPNRGEFNPAWSPDGRYIVHDVVEFGRNGAPVYQDLAVTEVASGVSIPLSGSDQGNDAAWHPKGDIIAFDRAPAGDFSIYSVPAAGGSRTRLLTDAVDPTWSQDGDYLAFHRPSEEAIYILNLNTGTVTFVDEGEAPTWDQYHGEYITFAKDGDIFSVRVVGGIPAGASRQQTFDPGFDGGPTYSSTAKHIVFMTNRAGQFDLWIVYAFGGTPTYLTGSPVTDEFDPAGRSGSREVAYAGRNPGKKEKTASLNSSGLAASSYPNPFNPVTTIAFSLPAATHVTLTVYDLLGRQVATLVEESLEAGSHAVRFDASHLPSGTYLYRILANEASITRRIVLHK